MKNRFAVQNRLNNEKFRLFACAASGIFSSLPFFIPSLFILEWFSSVPLFLVLSAPCEYSGRRAFRYGFVHHVSLSVVVLSWFSELLSMSALEYPKALMIAVVAVAVLCISALQGILFGLAAVFMRKVLQKPRFWAVDYILCALLPTAAEIILSFGRFGFPWVVLYLTQRTFLPGIQTASLFGGHFISFLLYLVNLLAAKGILQWDFHAEVTRHRLRAFLCAGLIFAVNLMSGFAMLAFRPEGKTIHAALYQDNHSSYEKWSGDPLAVCDEFIGAFESTYTAETAPDLVLLSETVFITALGREEALPNSVGAKVEEKLCRLSEQYGTTVVCGAFFNRDEKQFNAQFAFENGSRLQTVYCKRTLVPFGEYMPYENTLNRLFPFLREMNLSGDSLSPGKDAAVWESNGTRFGGLICYDSIFYENARNSAKNKADYLLLSTNDSWYNDSAAIEQHFGHAVFRAVENRKSIVRCATTGRSGLIDAYGNTLKKSDLFTRCILNASLSTAEGTTLFTRFGYLYVPITVFICLLFRFIGKKNPCRTEEDT